MSAKPLGAASNGGVEGALGSRPPGAQGPDLGSVDLDGRVEPPLPGQARGTGDPRCLMTAVRGLTSIGSRGTSAQPLVDMSMGGRRQLPEKDRRWAGG